MDAGKKCIAVVVAYFLIYVVWGSTYYFIGVALKGFPPFLLGALRFTAAGVILLVLCYLRKEQIFRGELVWRSSISGIVLLFIDMAVIMLAQQYVSSSLVAIVASSTAIWIMLLDIPMWKQNFRNPAVIGGILLGFSGVGMLYFEQLDTKVNMPYGEYGILLLIGGCISWALGTLYTKYCSCKTESVNGFAGSAWQMFSASVMFWICAVAFSEVQEADFSGIPLKAWAALAYLVVFGSILAYSAYVWLLKVRPATEVATHAYVNPVVAIIIGVGLGGEQVTIIQGIGLVVILTSVVLVDGNIGFRKKDGKCDYKMER
ncbi:MAG: EamA family transporter [Bacteroidales bacterium]|nr:EamA family transporter [Bacteroidales bacterium]